MSKGNLPPAKNQQTRKTPQWMAPENTYSFHRVPFLSLLNFLNARRLLQTESRRLFRAIGIAERAFAFSLL